MGKVIDRNKKLKAVRQGIKMYCIRIHEQHCDTCPLKRARNKDIGIKGHTIAAKAYCDQCEEKKCDCCLFKMVYLDKLYS